MTNPLLQLNQHGQSVWLDNLSRNLIESGELRRLVEQDGISGITSNPAIFAAAISKSDDYDRQIADLADSDRDTVLRASVGRYGTGLALRSGAFATQGFSAVRQPISPNSQLTPALMLSEGFDPLEVPLPNLSADAANNTDADVVLPTAAQPTITSASVSVEQRLPAGLILRANGSVDQGVNMLTSVAVGFICAIAAAPMAWWLSAL